jgi:hypothetical protein
MTSGITIRIAVGLGRLADHGFLFRPPLTVARS